MLLGGRAVDGTVLALRLVVRGRRRLGHHLLLPGQRRIERIVRGRLPVLHDTELVHLRGREVLLQGLDRPQLEVPGAMVRVGVDIPVALEALLDAVAAHPAVLDTVAKVFVRVASACNILLGEGKAARDGVEDPAKVVLAHVIHACVCGGGVGGVGEWGRKGGSARFDAHSEK
jgi:hypothetical protein